MKKSNIFARLLTTLIVSISVSTLASPQKEMTMKNTSEIKTKCSLKGELELSTSKGEHWEYVGYGDLICGNESTPSTVFLGIQLSKETKSKKENTKIIFQANDFELQSVFNIFQDYEVSTDSGLNLNFFGNKDFPAVHISIAQISSDKLSIENLENLLKGSHLRIEQDQFFELDEF